MAGKHRKSSRRRSSVARRGAPSLAAAAVSATSLSTALMTGTTTAAVPMAVELMAVITPANSTSQFFAGATYYGTVYTTQYGEQVVIPFLLGPQGIATAVAENNDGDPDVILASGWGAGQTGAALGTLGTADLEDVDLVILDNNTNRAGGGFWTTYYPFAPLLLTSAEPTPTDLPDGLTVLDVGYEYNINGNAPVDPLNPFTLGNSLAAYAFGYGAEATALNITQEADGDVILHQADGANLELLELEPGTHYVVKDGNVVEAYPAGTAESNPSTIYVTVDSGDLPLTRALRLVPGGAIAAAFVDPTLTELVNAGYGDGLGVPGNEAIPLDPTVPRPMQPGSSLANLGGVPASVQQGLDEGVQSAEDHVSSPELFVTGPVEEAGKLPFVSSLPSLANTSTLTSSATNRVDTTGGNMVFPGMNSSSGTSSSTGGSNPVQRVADRLSNAVDNVKSRLSPQSNNSAGDSED